MKLSPEQFQMLSALFDQALELPPPQRSAWIADITERHPGMAPEMGVALRSMLESQVQAQTVEFMRTLPKLVEADGPALAGGPEPGAPVGAYRLVRELCRGGMGAVWLAERADGVLKRPVALKLPLLSGESSALRERFARERDILAALSHPNIARLYDAGFTHLGQPFLALEYIEGRTLLDDCAARGLGLRERLDLFGQVLEAVKYAHANLVVHRDLKPSNILVTADGQVKLLDFGIAKLVADGAASETELTQLGGRAMTPDYASPEQVLGHPITTATDVYSLGVLLCELMCGERPYRLKRTSRGALEEAIVTVEPLAPSTMVRDPARARELRGDLDTIVLKALKKTPAERYESAAALAEDLRRHRAHLPVLAQPDSSWYHFNRFVVRNWIPVAAIAGVFVALVAGTGVALWQAHNALQAQARADEVKRFIASIFSDTGPAQGKGGMASAAELLERASQRVPREFAANPRVAAELDRIIGEALEHLGEDHKAREHLEQALKRDSAALGEHDLAVLRLKIGLAGTWQATSAEAKPLLIAAADELRRLGQAGAGDLVYALRELSIIQVQDGGEQALATAREGVAVADRWLEPGDPQRLIALSTLVDMLRVYSRYPEALVVAQRAVELARQQLGSQRPNKRLAMAEADLALVLSHNDRPAEAAVLARQALTDLTALESGDNVDVYWAALALAQSLRLSGQLNEAIDNYGRAIRILGRQVTGPSADKGALHQRLGETQLDAGRPGEALAEIQIADQSMAAAGGDPNRWRTLERQLDRAQALIYLARIDEARALIDTVSMQPGQGAAGADPTHQFARVAQLRALALRLNGQGRQAVDVAGAALRQAPEGLGPRTAAGLRVALAQALLDTGQAQAARPLLVEALAQYQTAQVDLSPRLADALVSLGRADLDLARPESALASLKRAHDFWRQFDPNNLWAAESAYWYGRALVAAGQLDPGRGLIAPARARLLRSPFAVHRQLVAVDQAARG
ncbi:MAG TPA: protein kinase [Burkholderiaceae bacterium]|jgi:serine/threonine-protein kinase|nr:protein kinase [Burkholderiaceae bacterium]